jgi:hypothetical protein
MARSSGAPMWSACSPMKTPLPASSALSSAAAADELGLAFWNSVKDSYWREELQAYLDQHPNGHFTALARARLSSLDVT